MATTLTVNAIEKSTYIITAAFSDENDTAVTPKTLLWTLSDLGGNIINSRTGIDYEVDDGTGSAGTLASSISVVLTGDDLQITKDRPTETRRFLLEATYDSVLGADLNLRGSCSFEVENLSGIV